MVEIKVGSDQKSAAVSSVEGAKRPIAVGAASKMDAKDLLTIQKEVHKLLYSPKNKQLPIPASMKEKITPADAGKLAKFLAAEQHNLARHPMGLFSYFSDLKAEPLMLDAKQREEFESHLNQLSQKEREKLAVQLTSIANKINTHSLDNSKKLDVSKTNNSEEGEVKVELANSFYPILMLLAKLANELGVAFDKARIIMANLKQKEAIEAANKRFEGAKEAFTMSVAADSLSIAGNVLGGAASMKATGSKELDQIKDEEPLPVQKEPPKLPENKAITPEAGESDSAIELRRQDASPLKTSMKNDPLAKAHEEFSTGKEGEGGYEAHSPEARERYNAALKEKLNQSLREKEPGRLAKLRGKEPIQFGEDENVIASSGKLTTKGRAALKEYGYTDEDIEQIQEHTVYSAQKESYEANDTKKAEIQDRYEAWSRKRQSAMDQVNNEMQARNVKFQLLQNLINPSTDIIRQEGELEKATDSKDAEVKQADAERTSAQEQAMASGKASAQKNFEDTLSTAQQILQSYIQAQQAANVIV